jgi:hypothetical protein
MGNYLAFAHPSWYMMPLLIYLYTFMFLTLGTLPMQIVVEITYRYIYLWSKALLRNKCQPLELRIPKETNHHDNNNNKLAVRPSNYFFRGMHTRATVCPIRYDGSAFDQTYLGTAFKSVLDTQLIGLILDPTLLFLGRLVRFKKWDLTGPQ